MKYDRTNRDLIAYAKAVRASHDAFYARFDGKRQYDPEAIAQQLLADDHANEARCRYVVSDPPGLHTHSIYLCFDSWPYIKTIFHNDLTNPDWVSLHAWSEYYSPLFPDMMFDASGEDGTVQGTHDDCMKLAAMSLLPGLDIDRIDPDHMGEIHWSTACDILGIPNVYIPQRFADTLTVLKHFHNLIRDRDDHGGVLLNKRFDRELHEVAFNLHYNHELPHTEFNKWLEHLVKRTGDLDEVSDMLCNHIDACIQLVNLNQGD